MFWLGICMGLAVIAIVGMFFEPGEDVEPFLWWIDED